MAIDLLNNCHYDLSKIKKLYLGYLDISGNTISYPLEYKVIPNSVNSLIQYDFWTGNTIYIGGQLIVLNEVLSTGENFVFTEEMTIDNKGKNFNKTITFNINGIDLTLVNSAEGLLDINNGKKKMIAIMIDDNDQYLICGNDIPVELDRIASAMGEDNLMTVILGSSSKSRARAIRGPLDCTLVGNAYFIIC